MVVVRCRGALAFGWPAWLCWPHPQFRRRIHQYLCSNATRDPCSGIGCPVGHTIYLA